ncbi:hypothetical protein KP509_1Z288500 [Ceratopteris richardii]|nr:hypothetical protein KP509_1Z288500 [Ceratopteris richardii]
MYHELQKQQAAQKGSVGLKAARGGSFKGQNSIFPTGLKYDAIGWVIFALAIAAWIQMIRKKGFPTPPPPPPPSVT